MDEATLTLLRHQDTCPSHNIPITDQLHSLHSTDTPSLYSDFRSPSRAAQQSFRKGRARGPGRRRCTRYCYICSPRHLRNRGRRLQGHRDECVEEAYWDKRLADLEEEERAWCLDLVERVYDQEYVGEVLEAGYTGYRDAAGDLSGVDGAEVDSVAWTEAEAEADASNWLILNPHIIRDLNYRPPAEDGEIPALQNLAMKTRMTEWTFVNAMTAAKKTKEEEEWDVLSEISSTGSWRVVDVGYDSFVRS